MTIRHSDSIPSWNDASCLHELTAKVRCDISILKYEQETLFYNKQLQKIYRCLCIQNTVWGSRSFHHGLNLLIRISTQQRSGKVFPSQTHSVFSSYIHWWLPMFSSVLGEGGAGLYKNCYSYCSSLVFLWHNLVARVVGIPGKGVEVQHS